VASTAAVAASVFDTDNPNLGNQLLGLGLVLVSLLFDGLTGARQDNWSTSADAPSGFQLMFGMNLWASVQLLVALVAMQQLAEPIHLIMQHPTLLFDLSTFCVISALGQKFIFLTVSSFSALTCSIITTTRKFFTIFASVLWFRHPLSLGQWVAVIVVFIALGMGLRISESLTHIHSLTHSLTHSLCGLLIRN
jgi:solute carrier family 35 (UDP-galactose transporter), member B1